jgi:hypothetical protein
MEEKCEKPTGVKHISHGAKNSSVGALVRENQTTLHEDCGDQTLRSNPLSRSPPPRPELPDYTSEGREQYFERQEAQEEHSNRAAAPKTPERFNLNKALPEINSVDCKKVEGKKDGEKWGFRNLFTRK